MNPPVVALLTDYGGQGIFVGSLKAVILALSPNAVILDLAHDIAPQDVEEGAFVLSQSVSLLPAGTICVGVIDPGVGTARPAIALRTPGATFVGPDNGLFSGVLEDGQRPKGNPGLTQGVEVPTQLHAVELANPTFHRLPVSSTFHGRDIFAPVAARLSLGAPLESLGPPVDSIEAFPPWRAAADSQGAFEGRIVFVDHFGNLVTDLRARDMPNRLLAEVAGRTFSGPQRTFQDGPEFVVYAGSSGFLEIGRRNGSAAQELSIGRGAAVRVRAAD
jgi:S-adenosyl-L-methionine hydrolase (adenosine-forming)